MVSHEERRKERLEIISNSIKNAKDMGKEINKDKLIATCMMEWGASRRTILEYIKVVEVYND